MRTVCLCPWRHWTPFVVVKDQYSHQSCKRIMKLKEKTPLLHNSVCFHMPKKSFRSEVSYLSEKLLLSQKLRYFRGSYLSQCFNYQQLSIKLGRYHDIIEYRDTNLETILISDRFGFNQNIDISRYIAISIKYSNIGMKFPSWDIFHPIGLE